MSGEAVNIKGTKNGLVIIFNPDMDVNEIKNNLKLKMETSKGFFKGAKFSVFNSRSDANNSFIDELERICLQYGLIPSGEVSWPPAPGKDEPASARRKPTPVIPIRQQSQSDGEVTLLLKRTIRSGQRISSRHNVMVMGDVNPGAEVISEGSIYVMGACKGIVHAGVNGNLMSEVFALRLMPIILRIGSIAADGIPPDLAGPGMAKVHRGSIVISEFINSTMQEL